MEITRIVISTVNYYVHLQFHHNNLISYLHNRRYLSNSTSTTQCDKTCKIPKAYTNIYVYKTCYDVASVLSACNIPLYFRPLIDIMPYNYRTRRTYIHTYECTYCGRVSYALTNTVIFLWMHIEKKIVLLLIEFSFHNNKNFNEHV